MIMDSAFWQAMAQIAEGCGVKLVCHADGKLQRDGCGSSGSLDLLYVLMYAVDVVLLSSNGRLRSACMLQVMVKETASLGSRINAGIDPAIDKNWKEGMCGCVQMLKGNLIAVLSCI